MTSLLPLNSSVRARSLVCAQIKTVVLPSTSPGSDTSVARPGSVRIPSVSCPSFLVRYPRPLPPSRDICRRCTLAVSSLLHGRLVTLSLVLDTMTVCFSCAHHLRRDSYSAVSHVRRCELCRSCLPRETQCRPRSAPKGFNARAPLPC